MLSKDLQLCGPCMESNLGVGSVAEGFVAGAAASAQGSEHLPIKVDEVWTVFSRLDFYCVHG